MDDWAGSEILGSSPPATVGKRTACSLRAFLISSDVIAILPAKRAGPANRLTVNVRSNDHRQSP